MKGDKAIEGLLSTAMESLRKMVDVNTVVGEMLTTPDGTSIIPISKVALGFLAGGGEYGKAYGNPPAEMAFGGGSGAGVSVNPVGFLVVHGEHIRFMPVEGQMAMEKLVDMAPGLISQVEGMFRKKGKNNADDIEV